MNIGSPVGAVVIDVPPDHGEQDCAEEQHHVSPLGLVGDGGRAYRLPSGTYLKRLKKDCEFRTEPAPLRYGILEDDWRQGVDALEQAKAEGLRSAAAMFEDRRQAGEPVTVAVEDLQTWSAFRVIRRSSPITHRSGRSQGVRRRHHRPCRLLAGGSGSVVRQARFQPRFNRKDSRVHLPNKLLHALLMVCV
jgi:hypothetical protein